jgi:uncharacterized protein
MLFRIVTCILIITLAIACGDGSATTADTTHNGTDTAKDTPKYEMKTYWLVFLLKGPNRTHDSATSARIQQAHLANIDRLNKEGKIIMAGPMGYNKDLRGIFIMDCKDSAEAASYIKTDTAIVTGRLRFEIHPWWTAKGKYEFK